MTPAGLSQFEGDIALMNVYSRTFDITDVQMAVVPEPLSCGKHKFKTHAPHTSQHGGSQQFLASWCRRVAVNLPGECNVFATLPEASGVADGIIETRELLAADVRITEFAASNSDSLVDGDGNSPDWIEIQNQGDTSADLNGWFLTDSREELTKWPFPAIQLAPNEFLVVLASAPDDGSGGVLSDYVDAGGNLHTNFQLSSSGEFVGLVDNNGANPELVSQFDFGEQRTDVSFVAPGD